MYAWHWIIFLVKEEGTPNPVQPSCSSSVYLCYKPVRITPVNINAKTEIKWRLLLADLNCDYTLRFKSVQPNTFKRPDASLPIASPSLLCFPHLIVFKQEEWNPDWRNQVGFSPSFFMPIAQGFPGKLATQPQATQLPGSPWQQIPQPWHLGG